MMLALRSRTPRSLRIRGTRITLNPVMNADFEGVVYTKPRV